VRLGEVIANTFTALLVSGIVGILFFLSGRIPWPERHGRMVIIQPIDRITTTSTETQLLLPATFDATKAPARPKRLASNQ
jgi:hypothetical protein